jgi:leucyl-tRNA synthetase
LWKTVQEHLEHGEPKPLNKNNLNSRQKDLRRKTHETILKVSDDYGRRNTFNTAIAAVMELLNEVAKHNDNEEQTHSTRHEALESAILLLSPVAPHICHSLWQRMGSSEQLTDAIWPEVDNLALVRSVVTIVLQVNGKVRGKIDVSPDVSKEELEDIAINDSNVKRFTEGNTIRKVIVIPRKLINIVAN